MKSWEVNKKTKSFRVETGNEICLKFRAVPEMVSGQTKNTKLFRSGQRKKEFMGEKKKFFSGRNRNWNDGGKGKKISA